MQTLWSRIAQSGVAGNACKCPQCLTFAGGLTRRVGAGASRRTPKYLTSSTLWYSGIFAAAATLDAGAKVRRREKWDRAIAEVRQELGKEEDGAGLVRGEKADKALVEEDGNVLYVPGILDEVFEELEPTFKQPRWPSNTGPPLEPWNLAPESVYAYPGRRAKRDTRAWTPKKIETISLSVDMLQLRIMIALINRSLNGEAALEVPGEYGTHLLQSRDSLHEHKNALKIDLGRVRNAPPTLEGYERTSGHLPLNAFSSIEAGERGYRTPRDLNLSLQSLFKEHKRQVITTHTLLARICYNLSVTPLPPNLDTYNTLLLGLSAAGQPDIVTHIIRSLQQCNLRPNETSIAAILKHYTVTDDAPSFVHFVQKMRGKHAGLSLARPDIEITDVSNGRLIPAEDDPTKIIQLPYPTPKVFAALIAGVTKFGGFDTALGVCKNMGEEGWGLCMSGLDPLLQDCADRRDWEAGLSVWEQIQQLEAKSKRMSSSRQRGAERIPLQVYAAMLRLCLGRGEKERYEDIWQQATKVHRHGAWDLAKRVKGQMEAADKRAAEVTEPEAVVEVASQTAEMVERYQELNQLFQGQLQNSLPASDEPESEQHEVASQSIEMPGKHANATMDREGAARLYPTNGVLHELRAQRTSTHQTRPQYQELNQLLQEQLHGSLPARDDLEQYEAAERPMHVNR